MPTLPAAITTYEPTGYLRRFTAEPGAAQALLAAAGAGQFFIVRVEQLYAHFTQPVPPARATAHTCLYLTAGAARMRVGNEAYTIGPHELLIVRAGQVYAFEPGDENTGFLCHFHDDVLLGKTGSADTLAAFDFLHFWGQPVVRPDAQTAGFIEQLLQRLLVEYGTHQLRYPAIVRAYLLALLHELQRAYAAEAPVVPTAAGIITAQFKHLVATLLPTTYRVHDYADRLHVSPNHLGKCVRRVTGRSPARWIEESLVLEAKVLLFQSAWPVAEVAAAVGIADASYFSRLFKKHTGLTPLAFRKRHNPS